MKRKTLLITALVMLVGVVSMTLTACVGISLTAAQLSEATMASNVDEITGQPLDKTDTFNHDVPKIFASVKLSNAPDDTEVSAEWIYVSGDMEDVENYTIMTLSDKYEGTQYLYFFISETEGGWPGGNYKVVLSIDGEEQLTIPFTVIPPAIPPKPENLLASDTEYQDLWETFDNWGMDFHSLFTSYSEQGINEGWNIMWLGSDEDESSGVYFKHIGDDWEPYDLTAIPPKPENLLASDAEYQGLWVTFDSWEQDFHSLFTSYSEQGVTEGWTTMWLGNNEKDLWVYFNRVGDSWEPNYMPLKPENLLASDAEYQDLWETFNRWALDFNSLFASTSQQSIAEGLDTMWLGSTQDETRRVYFTRVEDSWEPNDEPPTESFQEIRTAMPKRDFKRVSATFTNTLEEGNVIEGFIEISGEFKTQDWSFDWTGEVIDPEGDTIDIFRGHWVKETRYDLDVEITSAGAYTIRVRHSSKFEKELLINIRPEGWS